MSDPDLKKLSENISSKVVDARQKAEVTLDTASQGAGVSKEVMHRIERGTTLPSTRILAKLAHYFKITFKIGGKQ